MLPLANSEERGQNPENHTALEPPLAFCLLGRQAENEALSASWEIPPIAVPSTAGQHSREGHGLRWKAGCSSHSSRGGQALGEGSKGRHGHAQHHDSCTGRSRIQFCGNWDSRQCRLCVRSAQLITHLNDFCASGVLGAEYLYLTEDLLPKGTPERPLAAKYTMM